MEGNMKKIIFCLVLCISPAFLGSQSADQKPEEYFNSKELAEFLTGAWECITPGKFKCKFDIYSNKESTYPRDFNFFLTDPEINFEFFNINGGLSSYKDTRHEEIDTLTLHFYDSAMEAESYFIRDRGIHKSKRMMSITPFYQQEKSIFSEVQFDERYIYSLTPVVFAKETKELRKGKKLTNGTFNVMFWEFDKKKNTVWVTDSSLDGSDPACVSVEYKINGAAKHLFGELLPGMDCIIKTNARGEVVELILSSG